MKPFESQGIWWLPELPDRTIPGTLRADEDGALRLSLFGGGLVDRDPSQSSGQFVIHGVTFGSPGEQPVTLKDCFVNHQTFTSSGVYRQEFVSHRAFLGGHLANPNVFLFRSTTLKFSGLASWAGRLTGFKGTRENMFNVVWEPPPEIRGQFPEGAFILYAGCHSSDSRREREWKESVALSVTRNEPATDVVFERDIVYPLQNFLTFATDQPNAITDFHLKYDPGMKKIEIVGPRTFSDEESGQATLDVDMLFTFEDIRGRFEQVLRSWCDLSRRYAGAFALYFAYVYKPLGYVDLRFQLLMQTVSVFLIESSNGTEQHPLAVFPQSLDAFAAGLATLTDRHDLAFGSLIGGHEPQVRQAFVMRVVNTLRHVLVRHGLSTEPFPETTHLYWLGEQVAFLFKIAILSDLGFSPNELQELLSRNRRYKHISRVIVPQLAG